MIRKTVLALAIAGIVTTGAVARGGGGHSSGSHSSSTGTYHADHVVSGYTRADGTYVQSYHATNPNGTKNDNYSTKGNTNPYTGEAGTKPHDGEGPG